MPKELDFLELSSLSSSLSLNLSSIIIISLFSLSSINEVVFLFNPKKFNIIISLNIKIANNKIIDPIY